MHNPTKYIFAFLSLLASSCNNHHNHDTEVAAIFREWIGKELLLPNNLTFFIQNDSINPALSNPDLKIINYINSSECTSCSMKLSSWNDAMDDFNSLPDIEVELLTIINSTDKRSISNQLRIDNHFHPVAMDSAELFNKINSLPSRHELHTFLTDAENRIIAIGNPVLNPKVKEVFMQHIIASSNLEYHPNSMSISAARSYGAISVGDELNVNFYLSNHSNMIYNLQDIITSCDCISTNTTFSAIRPGETVPVEVSFKADSTIGLFKKHVNVFFYEKDSPETLVINGYIK